MIPLQLYNSNLNESKYTTSLRPMGLGHLQEWLRNNQGGESSLPPEISMIRKKNLWYYEFVGCGVYTFASTCGSPNVIFEVLFKLLMLRN